MEKGRRAIEKIGKKQELRKAGIVTTRIQQQSRCTTFRWSKAEGQEQRGQSWATRGCRYRVGPERSCRVSLGGSSMSQVAGPEKSIRMQSVVRDLMADILSPSACRPFLVRDLMADTYPHGCWILYYPFCCSRRLAGIRDVQDRPLPKHRDMTARLCR